uniref:Uncharacterized protein n=1 Tax=Arundo donax TaxID=35708 RepID=A0A0A9TYX4_ARUDO
MSGCQRLWRGTFCSHGCFFTSMGTTNLGVRGAMFCYSISSRALRSFGSFVHLHMSYLFALIQH